MKKEKEVVGNRLDWLVENGFQWLVVGAASLLSVVVLGILHHTL